MNVIVIILAAIVAGAYYVIRYVGDSGTAPASTGDTMIISESAARMYASMAGFDGESLDTIVAIARAESSLDAHALNINRNGTIDRGILQINDRWHPDVSETDAFNPATAFRIGYAISKQGTDFSPWVTYNTGAYKRYLPNEGIA